MIPSLISIAILLVPPVFAVAAFLLWKRTRLWGLLPITAGLALFAAFIFITSLASVGKTASPMKEEDLDRDLDRLQPQLIVQLCVAALIFTGSVGLIWECRPSTLEKSKE